MYCDSRNETEEVSSVPERSEGFRCEIRSRLGGQPTAQGSPVKRRKSTKPVVFNFTSLFPK